MNFDQIWEEYQVGVKLFIRSKISNPADVDDLLQEVMIKTFNNLHNVRSADNIKSWLYQIAKNVLFDHYRKQGKLHEVRAEDLWYEQDSSKTDHLLSNCLEPFIRALPERSAKLLTAIDIQGNAQKKYAQENGIAYSTLKSQVQKARRELRKSFIDCCNFRIDNRGNVIDCHSKSSEFNYLTSDRKSKKNK